ncbi:MAG: hypothetical protein NTZ40_10345 [Cyanobacteria bacterium]|nr:hypothetical protein [Cyanobacteriota bacterium]
MGFRVAVGKALRGSSVEAAYCSKGIYAQFSVYTWTLGVAMAQPAYGTGESHERKVLQKLLSWMDPGGVLIQPDVHAC